MIIRWGVLGILQFLVTFLLVKLVGCEEDGGESPAPEEGEVQCHSGGMSVEYVKWGQMSDNSEELPVLYSSQCEVMIVYDPNPTFLADRNRHLKGVSRVNAMEVDMFGNIYVVGSIGQVEVSETRMEMFYEYGFYNPPQAFMMVVGGTTATSIVAHSESRYSGIFQSVESLEGEVFAISTYCKYKDVFLKKVHVNNDGKNKMVTYPPVCNFVISGKFLLKLGNFNVEFDGETIPGMAFFDASDNMFYGLNIPNDYNAGVIPLKLIDDVLYTTSDNSIGYVTITKEYISHVYEKFTKSKYSVSDFVSLYVYTGVVTKIFSRVSENEDVHLFVIGSLEIAGNEKSCKKFCHFVNNVIVFDNSDNDLIDGDVIDIRIEESDSDSFEVFLLYQHKLQHYDNVAGEFVDLLFAASNVGIDPVFSSFSGNRDKWESMYISLESLVYDIVSGDAICWTPTDRIRVQGYALLESVRDISDTRDVMEFVTVECCRIGDDCSEGGYSRVFTSVHRKTIPYYIENYPNKMSDVVNAEEIYVYTLQRRTPIFRTSIVVNNDYRLPTIMDEEDEFQFFVASLNENATLGDVLPIPKVDIVTVHLEMVAKNGGGSVVLPLEFFDLSYEETLEDLVEIDQESIKGGTLTMIIVVLAVVSWVLITLVFLIPCKVMEFEEFRKVFSVYLYAKLFPEEKKKIDKEDMKAAFTNVFSLKAKLKKKKIEEGSQQDTDEESPKILGDSLERRIVNKDKDQVKPNKDLPNAKDSDKKGTNLGKEETDLDNGKSVEKKLKEKKPKNENSSLGIYVTLSLFVFYVFSVFYSSENQLSRYRLELSNTEENSRLLRKEERAVDLLYTTGSFDSDNVSIPHYLYSRLYPTSENYFYVEKASSSLHIYLPVIQQDSKVSLDYFEKIVCRMNPELKVDFSKPYLESISEITLHVRWVVIQQVKKSLTFDLLEIISDTILPFLGQLIADADPKRVLQVRKTVLEAKSRNFENRKINIVLEESVNVRQYVDMPYTSITISVISLLGSVLALRGPLTKVLLSLNAIVSKRFKYVVESLIIMILYCTQGLIIYFDISILVQTIGWFMPPISNQVLMVYLLCLMLFDAGFVNGIKKIHCNCEHVLRMLKEPWLKFYYLLTSKAKKVWCFRICILPVVLVTVLYLFISTGYFIFWVTCVLIDWDPSLKTLLNLGSFLDGREKITIPAMAMGLFDNFFLLLLAGCIIVWKCMKFKELMADIEERYFKTKKEKKEHKKTILKNKLDSVFWKTKVKFLKKSSITPTSMRKHEKVLHFDVVPKQEKNETEILETSTKPPVSVVDDYVKEEMVVQDLGSSLEDDKISEKEDKVGGLGPKLGSEDSLGKKDTIIHGIGSDVDLEASEKEDFAYVMNELDLDDEL